LRHLLALARANVRGEGRLTSIIGTAGDRTDDALREIGRIAAEQTDRVIVKETRRYLRGRESVDEMTALYLEGLAVGGNPPHTVATNEPEALEIALRDLQPGDVVAMMCIESGPESRARVEELGRPQPGARSRGARLNHHSSPQFPFGRSVIPSLLSSPNRTASRSKHDQSITLVRTQAAQRAPLAASSSPTGAGVRRRQRFRPSIAAP
jgi:hypothetical protein